MVASYIRIEFNKEQFTRHLMSMFPSCYRNVHGSRKQNKYINTDQDRNNENYREIITISVPQQVVSGPPTPLFVRLYCCSSSLHFWVWAREWWVEGEQSLVAFSSSAVNYLITFHPGLSAPTAQLRSGLHLLLLEPL